MTGNIRPAYSKEDASPDERMLWGSLADNVDALANLRIGYEAGYEAADSELLVEREAWVSDQIEQQRDRIYQDGHDAGYKAGCQAAPSVRDIAGRLDAKYAGYEAGYGVGYQAGADDAEHRSLEALDPHGLHEAFEHGYGQGFRDGQKASVADVANQAAS